MQRYRGTAIVIASLLAIAFAMMLHESAHALVGWQAGGSPTLITATETKGDWSSLSQTGFVLLGAAGSLANLMLCALGWWALSRRRVSAQFELTAWFFFAVNGMLLSTKLLAEALAGFGDLMSVLRPFQQPAASRVVAALLGAAGVVFMIRRAGPALARIIPPGEPGERMREGLRIILLGALASALLVVASSVANPLGTTRGVLLALGAGLSPSIPMFFGLRFIRKVPSNASAASPEVRWAWWLATIAAVGLMVFAYGPGIRLSLAAIH